jgi:3-deoxy-manno-octulosonate cytidylyltransferase (CMP-KDO synthetase)
VKYIIVIPARMQSTRLPGKPLVDIMGKSLIQRTYEQCIKAVDPSLVFVATDHEKIKAHCESFNMQVVMTSAECLTGTDRVAEVAVQIPADYYINVQGDEPLINPQDIKDVVAAIGKHPGSIINGYAPVVDAAIWESRSVPKVVVREDGRLLYMSRAPIPGNKSGNFSKAWRQVCVYAYPKSALEAFVSRHEKTELEGEEDLEILRFLEMGHEVQMVRLSPNSIAVDHPEDVERVVEKLKDKG